jgi:hypothetical protein
MMRLVNAADMARRYPDTFERPSDSAIKRLGPGDFAKVCADGERFWLRVTRAAYPYFAGTVQSKVLMDGVFLGDSVQFHADHVFDVRGGTP